MDGHVPYLNLPRIPRTWPDRACFKLFHKSSSGRANGVTEEVGGDTEIRRGTRVKKGLIKFAGLDSGNEFDHQQLLKKPKLEQP